LTIEIVPLSDVEKFHELEFLEDEHYFENAITFEPFEISTPDQRHFAQV
jgi:hypothetical protein